VAYQAIGRLFQHPWFERIWIIQEVAAGKEVHIMYNGVCIDWHDLTAAAYKIESNHALSSIIAYHLSPKASGPTISEIGMDVSTDYYKPLWNHVRLMKTIRAQLHGDQPLPLGELICNTIIFKAKEPRDKLYAILGISSDGHKLPFQPDYIDSDDDVFIRTTAYLLSTNMWFTWLAYFSKGYQQTFPPGSSLRNCPLPSWVPDYGAIPP
jgi:hypothetical protein